MECVRDGNGTILPAAPTSFQELIGYADKVWSNVADDVRDYGRKLRRASLFYVYDVSTVPVRPNLDKADPGLKIKVEAASRSFSKLYPWTLVEDNIGTTAGFHTILKRFYDEWVRPVVNKDRYFMLNVDVDIYYKILRVICNSSFESVSPSVYVPP